MMSSSKQILIGSLELTPSLANRPRSINIFIALHHKSRTHPILDSPDSGAVRIASCCCMVFAAEVPTSRRCSKDTGIALAGSDRGGPPWVLLMVDEACEESVVLLFFWLSRRVASNDVPTGESGAVGEEGILGVATDKDARWATTSS